MNVEETFFKNFFTRENISQGSVSLA